MNVEVYHINRLRFFILGSLFACCLWVFQPNRPPAKRASKPTNGDTLLMLPESVMADTAYHCFRLTGRGKIFLLRLCDRDNEALIQCQLFDYVC